jgi:hypothetical protein
MPQASQCQKLRGVLQVRVTKGKVYPGAGNDESGHQDGPNADAEAKRNSKAKLAQHKVQNLAFANVISKLFAK